MNKSNNIYNNLTDKDKKTLRSDLYLKEKLSFASIASKYDTYANKVRRDAVKLGITIRDKSEAQKNALSTGTHSHPTKGKVRSDQTKDKIGLSVMKSWDNLSIEELNRRSQYENLV